MMTTSDELEECPIPTEKPRKTRKREQIWSEEEQAAYWRDKKARARQRKRAAAAERRELQQREWEALSDGEQQRRRTEAAVVHEKRRAADARLHELCQEHLANAKLPVLVFDFSFAWCMNAPDCRSTVAQVKLSYSILRRHAFPMRPVITSIEGNGDRECAHSDILRSLSSFNGFNRYPLPIHDTHWSSLYEQERVVYLTADADTVLERLEEDTVYIVGAFVDRNARKFLSRDSAVRYGVRMARLPIDESIKVGNLCKVLTVNHVVEVLCRYSECGDWKTAFDVLPTRRVVGRRQRRRGSASVDAVTVWEDTQSGAGGGSEEGSNAFCWDGDTN